MLRNVAVENGAPAEIAQGDGKVIDRVAVSNHAFACMLGGPDRRTMFVLTADNSNPGYCRSHATGRIEVFAVDVGGAGFP